MNDTLFSPLMAGAVSLSVVFVILVLIALFVYGVDDDDEGGYR